ncbi:MAG: FAD-dependent oxidoreductase [Oscillospiraceae bacterium]|jgi:hypothetical protein
MDKNGRICIVGGGPAGTSMAMYLEKKGYTNYVIYEKTGRVGGKALSPKMEVTTAGGTKEMRTIEMGAVMGCETYFAVHECEEFGGTSHLDGPPMGRRFTNPDGTTIKQSKISMLKKLMKLNKLTKLLKTKYKGYDVNGHRGVAQGRYEGLCPSPELKLAHIEGENPNLKDLALPFSEFLKINGCEDAEMVWKGPFTAFGYGYFDEIPAAYVLKYLDAYTVRQFLNTGKLWTWKNGTESIWQGINDHLKNKVVLNTEVTGIDRSGEKIVVTLNGQDREEFDKLIICTPLELFLNYGDPTDEEKELFSKIRHKEYFTMAVRPEESKAPEISYYYFAHMTPETVGHLMVFYHRWPDCGPQPLVTFTLRNHEGSEDVPFEKAKEMTLADMEASGLPVVKTERIDDWYYFPHVNSEDYAAGWYDKVEALQGQKNTFYAGEVMAFGDMEEVCEYSKDLVRRFF